MDLGRVVTAMVTPFDDHGNVDFDKVIILLDHLIENGSDAIIIAGTTGESPTLSFEEKISLFQCAVDHAESRVPIIASTGTNNTKTSIDLTIAASKIGVHGIMLVSPYYNKPSQLGIYTHFKTIASETNLPIMIYNIPGRTSSHVEASTIIALSKIKNIKAIKESSGNLELLATIIEQTDDHFQVYTGDDPLALPSVAIGARGVVSVSSHIIGKQLKKMLTYYMDGKVLEAAQYHRQLLPIMKSLFLAPNPVCIKYAISQMLFNVGTTRLPLVPITASEKEKVDEQITRIKTIN
ncbi:4-hydroxy-tetrahydrodipicolinate synthase [Bacillus sp. JCM 19034]|uniref:4-hydroxy-tetrahydrodipicolinate synthase n=1 Tax=Bacillus sp. JCM 19034 TaxID=1481928 RepID=UPI000780B5AA|nr:4-hydroxy-tetrahydrodipicolinate synthase [Bacillus sp. JCM 19034]